MTLKHKNLLYIICFSSEQFMIYRLSYLWYTLMGSAVAILVGVLVTWFTKPNDPADVDLKLLAPFIRKWVKPRQFENEMAGEAVILAYQPTPVCLYEQSRKSVILQFCFYITGSD